MFGRHHFDGEQTERNGDINCQLSHLWVDVVQLKQVEGCNYGVLVEQWHSNNEQIIIDFEINPKLWQGKWSVLCVCMCVCMRVHISFVFQAENRKYKINGFESEFSTRR